MASKKYKGSLELNWINKDKSLIYEYDEEGNPTNPTWVEKDDILVSEPRILKLKSEYGDPENENMLIKGDNLLALKTLVHEFKNRTEKDRVKCIYIDPPYNTGNAFEHYEDNLMHSEWLTLMRDRLMLLKKVLRNDGLIFISIDDGELGYLKVLMDEIFGRNNFVTTLVVKPANPVGLKMKNAHKRIVRIKEFILVYAKNYSNILFTPQYAPYENYGHFKLYLEKNNSENPDDWEVINSSKIIAKEKNKKSRDVTEQEIKDFAIKHIDDIYCSSFIADRRDRVAFSQKNPEKVTIYRNPDGSDMYMYKKRALFPLMSKAKDFNGKLYPAEILCDLWLDIKWDGVAPEGGVTFQNGKKPEKLIQRILNLVTDEEDIILDSFLGSGTTVAVAHKMNRRWIGIEIGNHADSMCIPRLNRVVKGKDATGISKDINWKGGGGFRYYVLGDSLIKDHDINWGLEQEEIARALFMNFDYRFSGELVNEVYLGKREHSYSLCLTSKSAEILKSEQIEELIKKISEEKDDLVDLEIYTNMGMGVRQKDLPENISIKKIPESILRKYKL